MTNYKILIFLFAVSALSPCPAKAIRHTQTASTSQPTFTEWHDQQVNEVNRYPVHTAFFPYLNEHDMQVGDPAKAANYLSLEGLWKFCWVANADERPTDSSVLTMTIAPGKNSMCLPLGDEWLWTA